MTRLLSAAHAAPGHLASDLQRPDAIHPGEWVVVYRFRDAPSREAWLRSEVRLALIAEADEFVNGEPREQVLASPSGDTGVRAILSVDVTPGAEDAYYALHVQAEQAMRSFAGFRSVELLPPVPGVQSETVTIITFEGQEQLDNWLRSEVRSRLIERMDELVDSERVLSVVGGFAGWFDAGDSAQPKRWKQAVAVMIALFPTVLTLSVLSDWLLPDLALVPAVFLSNVLGVATLTWILMPPLTRLLDPWLRR